MKTCQNRECSTAIKKHKSAKRKYCNDRCKNRAAYIKKMEDEGDLIEKDKALRKNYKILKKLRELNLGAISHQTLKSHEFNFDAIHKDVLIKDKGNNIMTSCIYDLTFIINRDEKLIFI